MNKFSTAEGQLGYVNILVLRILLKLNWLLYGFIISIWNYINQTKTEINLYSKNTLFNIPHANQYELFNQIISLKNVNTSKMDHLNRFMHYITVIWWNFWWRTRLNSRIQSPAAMHFQIPESPIHSNNPLPPPTHWIWGVLCRVQMLWYCYREILIGKCFLLYKHYMPWIINSVHMYVQQFNGYSIFFHEKRHITNYCLMKFNWFDSKTILLDE